jgi:hypothetical protein
MQFARRVSRAGCLFVEYPVNFNFVTGNCCKPMLKMPENELRSIVLILRAVLSIKFRNEAFSRYLKKIDYCRLKVIIFRLFGSETPIIKS